MYAQLGNIVFEGLLGFESMDRSRASNYAEHALIDGKPRLQKVGENLTVINLTVNFSANFCNPGQMVQTLDDARSAGEVLPFITGAGEFLGNYVIKSVSESFIQTDPDGRLLEVAVKVELAEFYDKSLLDRMRDFAKQNARALENNNIAEVQPLKPRVIQVETRPAATMEQINVLRVESAAVTGELRAATLNPTQRPNLIKSAQKRLSTMDRALSKANNIIREADAQISNTTALINVFAAVAARISTLKHYAEANDIDGALMANEALQSDIRNLNQTATPVAALVATRRLAF